MIKDGGHSASQAHGWDAPFTPQRTSKVSALVILSPDKRRTSSSRSASNQSYIKSDPTMSRSLKSVKSNPLAGKVKKLMQTDEDVGKIAQGAPLLLGQICLLSCKLFRD